jgi:hypothetical protein
MVTCFIATTLLVLLIYLKSPWYCVGILAAPVWIGTSFIDPFLAFCGAILLVVSPFFLYLNRIRSATVMLLLLAGTIAVGFLKGEARMQPVVRTRIDRAAFVFAAYMAVNCLLGILNGNDGSSGLNELAPVVELYVCFWLAVRMSFSEKTIRTILTLTLVAVGTRAAWQLLLFVAGRAGSIIPPVYDTSEQAEFVADVGFRIVRLLDPVSCLHVAAAFALLVSSGVGESRRLVITTFVLTGAVLILSLERAEWLATIVCVLVILYLCKQNRVATVLRLGLSLAVIIVTFVALSWFFQKLSLDLDEVFLDRMIGYTQEQLLDPQNSLQELRLLEYSTIGRAFSTAPVFGHGLGANLGTDVFDGSSQRFVPIHNYFLNLLANAGLVGIGLFAYLAFAAGTTLVRLYLSAESSFKRGLTLYSIVALLWYAVFVSFHPIYSAYHIPALLGFYVGVALSLAGRRRNCGADCTSATDCCPAA